MLIQPVQGRRGEEKEGVREGQNCLHAAAAEISSALQSAFLTQKLNKNTKVGGLITTTV